jgi:uncharacterized protein (TIGR02246 family)
MKQLLCAAVLFSLAACTQTPAPVADTREADISAIHALEQSGQKAWAAKDIEGIMAQYASDAEFLVEGAPVAKGVQEIRAGMTGLLMDPALALQFASTVTEVAKSGDIAYQRGNYSITVTDEKTKKPIQATGSFVTVLKKQTDGSWKVVEDINVNGPAPK